MILRMDVWTFWSRSMSVLVYLQAVAARVQQDCVRQKTPVFPFSKPSVCLLTDSNRNAHNCSIPPPVFDLCPPPQPDPYLCSPPIPCQHNGTCYRINWNSYGYKCMCPYNWSGVNCEIYTGWDVWHVMKSIAVFSTIANLVLLSLFCAYNCHKPICLRKLTEEEEAILALESIPGVGGASLSRGHTGWSKRRKSKDTGWSKRRKSEDTTQRNHNRSHSNIGFTNDI